MKTIFTSLSILITTLFTSSTMAHEGHSAYLHLHAFEYGLFGLGLVAIAYFGLTSRRQQSDTQDQRKNKFGIGNKKK